MRMPNFAAGAPPRTPLEKLSLDTDYIANIPALFSGAKLYLHLLSDGGDGLHQIWRGQQANHRRSQSKEYFIFPIYCFVSKLEPAKASGATEVANRDQISDILPVYKSGNGLRKWLSDFQVQRKTHPVT